jgi:hypothetical protein
VEAAATEIVLVLDSLGVVFSIPCVNLSASHHSFHTTIVGTMYKEDVRRRVMPVVTEIAHSNV